MIQLNALSAEDGFVIRAIEVLDPFTMIVAELSDHALLVFFVEVKVAVCEFRVFFDNFVEDVNVKGKSFCTFKLFNQFSANWASNAIFVMKFGDTISTKSMSTVHENSGNPFANVIFKPTKLTNIEAP